MRNYLDKQLDTLHEKLNHMGDLCIEAITQSINVFIHDDVTLLDKVLEVDHEIDLLERDIEGLCMKLILHQQPVASDLRKISSALKMISDMERIGDQASNIAEIAQYIVGVQNETEDKLNEMAIAAQKMVYDSVHSYVNSDLRLAKSVMEYDDVVDEWFATIKREIMDAISKGNIETDGEYYIDLLMIAKYLERIGDHATNVAEWVEYSITGIHLKDGKVLDIETPKTII